MQVLSGDLGYGSHHHNGEVLGIGLSRITSLVLGMKLVKSKGVTCSNWASPSLNNQQLKYAALDVLMAGQTFRGLRLWHSTHSSASSSPCVTCKVPLGAVLKKLKGFVENCHSCGRATLAKSSQVSNDEGQVGPGVIWG